ncbi:hypothetical protein ACTXT7_007362 [Hymenolepis weldensis]
MGYHPNNFFRSSPHNKTEKRERRWFESFINYKEKAQGAAQDPSADYFCKERRAPRLDKEDGRLRDKDAALRAAFIRKNCQPNSNKDPTALATGPFPFVLFDNLNVSGIQKLSHD